MKTNVLALLMDNTNIQHRRNVIRDLESSLAWNERQLARLSQLGT